MKLAAKMLSVFFLVVILLTAASSYVAVEQEYDRFEARHRDYARQMATELKERIVVEWQQNGVGGLEHALEMAPIGDRQVRMRWVWFERETLGPDLSDAAKQLRRSAGGGEMVSVMTRDASGVRYLRVYCPVDVGAERQGGLEVTGSLEPIDAKTRDTITGALVTIGATALLGVAMVWLAGVRWVARPLERLMDKTRRIGKGDFSGPLQLKTKDELAKFAEALNDMCEQLTAQQQKIRTETAERIAAMDQLRHADRLKTVGRLAAGIAHELGTPLNVVSGRAGLIASGKLPAEEVTQSAATIKVEADRIAAIIRQLLDFARQRTPKRMEADLRDLVGQTVSLLKSLAEKRNVRIRVQGDDQPYRTCVDFGQIQQVLTNIVVNAIQSMPSGGEITITLADATKRPPDDAAADEQKYRCITVTDQGAGIAADDLEHIFEPFFTTKDVGEGTGLGLSIAYGIVHEHGGWIDVTSEPGRGSSFTVYLPKEASSCKAES
ncbi:MAG: HAMP domain-containing histidine kinase [Planctomycetes bacterium]|nr:HAMP domain-containing histidine kinase [Planctomycetota bacterium]